MLALFHQAQNYLKKQGALTILSDVMMETLLAVAAQVVSLFAQNQLASN